MLVNQCKIVKVIGWTNAGLWNKILPKGFNVFSLKWHMNENSAYPSLIITEVYVRKYY